MNRNLARGLAFMAVALFFGVQALGYRVGDLAHAGPGFFPLMLSAVVGLIGLALVIRSRLEQGEALNLQLKNIAIVSGSLVGFAVLAELVGALAGVVFLVFFSALAAETYDWKRNVKIALGLMLVTYLFSAVLGVSLRLY
jgi:hypothetical protein